MDPQKARLLLTVATPGHAAICGLLITHGELDSWQIADLADLEREATLRSLEHLVHAGIVARRSRLSLYPLYRLVNPDAVAAIFEAVHDLTTEPEAAAT